MTKVQPPLGQLKAANYSPRNRSSPRVRDSPARQLQLELEHAFTQVHLYDSERQKLDAFNRRSLIEDLDARELAQARAHKAEQDEASAQHENVRQQAEAVLQAYIKAEEEKRRREEEERRRLEEEQAHRQREEEEARRKAEEKRRRKEQAERKAREDHARAEAARKAAEEQRKAEAQEKDRKQREATAQKEAEEKAKFEQEAARKKAESQAVEQAASATLQAPTSVQDKPKPLSSDPAVRHKDYLAIHRKLKTFRKEFWESAKKNTTLKPVVGDMRRAIKTSVGQLTDDKDGNRKGTQRVRTAIMQAVKDIPSPPVVVNDYLPPHLKLFDENSTTVPSLVLYLLSIFSKAVMNAFVGECAVNTKQAEPIGTLAAQIFSLPELQFARTVSLSKSGNNNVAYDGSTPNSALGPSSVSLISVLMCKFHATAPMLFGISGSESTAEGRMRLGWRLDKSDDGKRGFVTEQRQYERLTGLGAGYASISLRNFSKAKVSNPYPPIHFWESVAWIVNTPPADVQTSQLIVLKSMLEVGVDRFILFFGAAAVAATREALVELPKRLPPDMAQKSAAKSVSLLAELFKKEKNFSLT